MFSLPSVKGELQVSRWSYARLPVLAPAPFLSHDRALARWWGTRRAGCGM
jgi:hypothetical protein